MNIQLSIVALLLLATFAHAAPVKLGIDVLAEQKFALLRAKRVGVITNHTGVDSNGTHLVQLLRDNEVNVVRLYSPEHGLYGIKDERVGDMIDTKTGLPVLSLYGKTRKPTKEMLGGIDVLVFDIQDVGTRYYTYISTLGLALEAAAENNVEFVVLDRPNPISGTRVEGPLAEDDHLSFVAYDKLPLVHGMTIGELAQYFNGDKKLNAKLTVIKMEGWKREMYWDDTGVKWINPSPNMHSPTQALLYPAIGVLELTNIAVGRGSDSPFEQFGAPYIKSTELVNALDQLRLPGVKFEAASWVPKDALHRFNGEQVNGVRVTVTDRDAYDGAATGMAFAWTLNRLYPGTWKKDALVKLEANDEVLEKLFALSDPTQIKDSWQRPLEQWKTIRAKYLLY